MANFLDHLISPDFVWAVPGQSILYVNEDFCNFFKTVRTTHFNRSPCRPPDYTFERADQGLRRIGGYGVTVTRAAASSMMFCFALLLLSMCRNLITCLRETFLHHYIPFDSVISFHKYVGCWAFVLCRKHVHSFPTSVPSLNSSALNSILP